MEEYTFIIFISAVTNAAIDSLYLYRYGDCKSSIEYVKHIKLLVINRLDLNIKKVYRRIVACKLSRYRHYRTMLCGILLVYFYICKFTGHVRKSLTQEEVTFLRIYLLCQKHATTAAINRLSQGAMKPEILALQCNQFVGSQTNEMKNIQDAVIYCRKDIDETRNRHIPNHIREGQLRILKDWKRHDIVFCNKTHGYKEAYEEVNKELMVTFIGGPGSGKTVTGRHIALLFERIGWEVIPVYKEDEIVRYGNVNIRQVFLLDDVIGSFALDMSRLNNIVSCKKTILNSINNRSKIVFTCRKTVYKEAIGLKPFVLEHIVDLESKTNELNELEKIQILTSHCLKAGVDEKLYINLILTSAKIMFPFLCQLFAADVKYQMFGSDFFERPFDYLLEEMNKLQKTNTAQYVSLVLCLVNNRKLSQENLPSKNVKKRIYNSCGLDRGTADRKIIDALSHIEGTYVVLMESEYSFIHDSIYEAIAFHYGQDFPEQILDYMPSNFIANKVTVFGNTSYDALCIQITENHFSKLAERLYSDLESYQLFDVFMSKALKYEPFLDVFTQLIRKKPYEDFKNTFLAPDAGNCYHLINSQEKDKEHGEEAGSTYYGETFKRELLTD
ncbi:unnamed protein product [Mytilus coruscus]|uniref:Novel STAND NTPase 3 domain-containing protein n=1 Tax=Mytilus coruscus TaxID=42192 RepID=A0A6J8CG08_MYTCO|nr:unnamed protein product [Mytilus coruscus]